MKRKHLKWMFGTYTVLVFGFLLIPPFYIVYQSFFPTPSPVILIPDEFTLDWFNRMIQDRTLMKAVRTSLLVSFVSAVMAVGISLTGARGYMKLSGKTKERSILLVLLPVFVPGIVFGLGLLVFLRLTGISNGLGTLVLAGLLWSLPFAMLIMLTTMSNLRPELRRASYDLGASEFYTFRKVEWPIVYPGVIGAFLFPFLLTFNEYIRSNFLAGSEFTIPVYIYSHVGAGGIPPQLFALGSTAILITTVLMIVYVAYFRYRQSKQTA